MENMILWLILLPFISSAIIGLIYIFFDKTKQSTAVYTFLGIMFPVVSCILAFMVVSNVGQDDVITATAFNWLALGNFHIEMEFMVDRLSAVMISFITFIGTLIHIYAAGYMKGDEGYGKFFAFFNLFLGSMLVLVLASNPIIMFIGWELVGLVSYLLVGFYFKDPENMVAANKAFIANRVGDFGFIIGLGLLFVNLDVASFDFAHIEQSFNVIDNGTLALIGIMLFIGAMGKSAQIPLYVWLPDAMAGPTPVSALIHAATMVTAGVYMVARFGFLYNEIPEVGTFIATIGALSALLAALIATYQTDIKKILAYSTMSQLGYMFIAVGLGAYSYGIFHVFTHAFFKALLFMGAGAVIIALHHQQDVFKMGRMKVFTPYIAVIMLIGTLAISGIPPFAGFFSKDAILIHAFSTHHYILWAMGVITAFLTAFYMFRLYFIVFVSDMGNDIHVHHVSKYMKIPLFFLAIGSALAGFLNLNEAYAGSSLFSDFINLPDKLGHVSHALEYGLGGLNVLIAALGIIFAYRKFVINKPVRPTPNSSWNKLAVNKFYVDELYDAILVKPLVLLSDNLKKIVDKGFVDAIINTSINILMMLSEMFGKLHNGKVRYYAFYILIGISMISLTILYNGGL